MPPPSYRTLTAAALGPPGPTAASWESPQVCPAPEARLRGSRPLPCARAPPLCDNDLYQGHVDHPCALIISRSRRGCASRLCVLRLQCKPPEVCLLAVCVCICGCTEDLITNLHLFRLSVSPDPDCDPSSGPALTRVGALAVAERAAPRQAWANACSLCACPCGYAWPVCTLSRQCWRAAWGAAGDTRWLWRLIQVGAAQRRVQAGLRLQQSAKDSEDRAQARAQAAAPGGGERLRERAAPSRVENPGGRSGTDGPSPSGPTRWPAGPAARSGPVVPRPGPGYGG